MKHLNFLNPVMLFIPAFAIIGAANHQHEWLGAIAGCIVGLVFALAFAGRLPNWLARAVRGDLK